MIKVSNIQVLNFEGALRGMRQPLRSGDKSDSHFVSREFCNTEEEIALAVKCGGTAPLVGEADLKLMKKLYKAGTEHRKYLRQIFVSMDVTAPLTLWKQADQYKVGTTTNSDSTMHCIHKKPFTLSDFSLESINAFDGSFYINYVENVVDPLLELLNDCREAYLETKDKRYWRLMIDLLPESYNQKRTITMNYENVISIIHQRSGHKLHEWDDLIKVLLDLPYIKEIIEDGNN